jgi:hypothetical protein
LFLILTKLPSELSGNVGSIRDSGITFYSQLNFQTTYGTNCSSYRPTVKMYAYDPFQYYPQIVLMFCLYAFLVIRIAVSKQDREKRVGS